MLTREEIEVWRRFLKSMDAMMSGQVDALCDMALKSAAPQEGVGSPAGPAANGEPAAAASVVRPEDGDTLQLRNIAARFRNAFTYDPGHSDLDNEQPIHITVTLGDCRALNYELERCVPQKENAGG